MVENWQYFTGGCDYQLMQSQIIIFFSKDTINHVLLLFTRQ